MKSLAVTGIIGEMQRKGSTKHCCDRGFLFSRFNSQQIISVYQSNNALRARL